MSGGGGGGGRGALKFLGEPKRGGQVTITHQIASTFRAIHATSLL